MRYLADTDWVADYLKGYRNAVSLLSRLAPDGIAISLTTCVKIISRGHTFNAMFWI